MECSHKQAKRNTPKKRLDDSSEDELAAPSTTQGPHRGLGHACVQISPTHREIEGVLHKAILLTEGAGGSVASSTLARVPASARLVNDSCMEAVHLLQNGVEPERIQPELVSAIVKVLRSFVDCVAAADRAVSAGTLPTSSTMAYIQLGNTATNAIEAQGPLVDGVLHSLQDVLQRVCELSTRGKVAAEQMKTVQRQLSAIERCEPM